MGQLSKATLASHPFGIRHPSAFCCAPHGERQHGVSRPLHPFTAHPYYLGRVYGRQYERPYGRQDHHY
eukprot:7217239-Pyramimonas_sp.AAC.1